MRKNIYLPALLLAVIIAGVWSCKKQTGTIVTSELSEYYPLEKGKYIRYRLDSMRFVNFGQDDTIIYYDAKDVVDEEVTDNMGRKSFRVIRYLRDTASVNEADYYPTLTYLVTPTRETIELNENNLRFQKLKLPVTYGFHWRGNTYLPTAPFYGLYQFSNDEDIDLWNYSYEGIDESVAIEDQVYENTISVLQVADSSNVPIEFPLGLAYKNYWLEQYAKNIGLVYKEVVMWEYQPPASGASGYRSGFGLRMRMIDHN